MLQLLRDNTNSRKILLNQAFFQDLNWFNIFLQQYNRVTYYENIQNGEQVHLDASLTGLGRTYNSMVHSIAIPRDYKKYSIVHLEAHNIVVACKLWAKAWEKRQIHIFCDNMALFEVLNTGKARDSVLAMCARNIWLISAMFNIHLKVIHITRKKNSLADLLSRWTGQPCDYEKLCTLCPQASCIPTHLVLTLLNTNI